MADEKDTTSAAPAKDAKAKTPDPPAAPDYIQVGQAQGYVGDKPTG